jgi:hypothetical protein
MTIKEKLQALVKPYASVDSKGKLVSKEKPGKDILLKLEADFIHLINQELLIGGLEPTKLQDGSETTNLQKNYRRLALDFHPDRCIAEVCWLEDALSDEDHKWGAFQTLRFCYEKFTKPAQFKKDEFSDIKSKEDFKNWLEKLRAKSPTHSGRRLYDGLIGLLNQSSSFFDETGKIKPQGLNIMLRFIPIALVSYGVIILAEELLAIHALYFVVLKGGQYLGRSNYRDLKQLGSAMQEMSIASAATTTIVLVRLLEMTFWTSRKCLNLSLYIGSSILKSILPSPVANVNDQEESFSSKVCKDLILAGQDAIPGIEFQTPELKVIAQPLEKYLILNAQQVFRGWRIGDQKREFVERFLLEMEKIDRASDSIDTKLTEVSTRLHKLKANKDIYTNTLAAAINNAEKVIAFFQDPSMQLMIYEPPVPALMP